MNVCYVERDYKYAKRNNVTPNDARYRRLTYCVIRDNLKKQGYKGTKLHILAAGVAKKRMYNRIENRKLKKETNNEKIY